VKGDRQPQMSERTEIKVLGKRRGSAVATSFSGRPVKWLEEGEKKNWEPTHEEIITYGWGGWRANSEGEGEER